MPGCPEGYKNDFLYYFPIAPFFAQPRGSDCGMNVLIYNIIGGITLVACVFTAFFCLFALNEDKVNKVARKLHFASFVLMLLNVSFLATGFSAPDDSVIAVYLFSIIFRNIFSLAHI